VTCDESYVACSITLLFPSDLKVRLASLQRARDKMKEMDTSLETCNAQASAAPSSSRHEKM
jgi:hypothetical protein